MSVTEDPKLGPAEKELLIRVDKKEQRLFIHTEIASVARHLLARPDFQKTDERADGSEIYAVAGYLPMGVLKIQQNARKHGSFANIVSTPDDNE